jgi:hypothetical protein
VQQCGGLIIGNQGGLAQGLFQIWVGLAHPSPCLGTATVSHRSRRHIPAAASHILPSRSQSYLND